MKRKRVESKPIQPMKAMKNVLIISVSAAVVVAAIILYLTRNKTTPAAEAGYRIKDTETCSLEEMIQVARQFAAKHQGNQDMVCVALKDKETKSVLSALDDNGCGSRAGKQLVIVGMFDTAKNKIVNDQICLIAADVIDSSVLALFGEKDMIILK